MFIPRLLSKNPFPSEPSRKQDCYLIDRNLFGRNRYIADAYPCTDIDNIRNHLHRNIIRDIDGYRNTFTGILRSIHAMAIPEISFDLNKVRYPVAGPVFIFTISDLAICIGNESLGVFQPRRINLLEGVILPGGGSR